MAAENVGAVKIDGYLEKKGKMKVVTTWKKYWFVLEGRLLLYYRSQEEYDKLSPCKGSINMGLATNIRPGLATAGVFQIITRTNTVTLRAKERAVQEKWLQALLDAAGQSTVTNPIRMNHFRYSMDDLIPSSAKHQHQYTTANTITTPSSSSVVAASRASDVPSTKTGLLARQNTLPHRFNNRAHRQNSIIDRIRQLGGQSYITSADGINRLTTIDKLRKPSEPRSQRNNNNTTSNSNTSSSSSTSETAAQVNKETSVSAKTDRRMDEPTEVDNNTEVSVGNELYAGLVIENAEYISAETVTTSADKADVDHNKNNNNCYLIENDQYLKSDEVRAMVTSNDGHSSSTQSVMMTAQPPLVLDDIEYYCTYEEINNLKAQLQSHIYNEPSLPPRPDERRMSDDNVSYGKEDKRRSPFMKLAHRFKSFKSDDSGLKKRSARLLMKMMGRKRSNNNSDGGASESSAVTEPIYDTVDYYEIDKAIQQKQDARELLQTLANLQLALEAKKSQIKDIISTGPSSPSSNEHDTAVSSNTQGTNMTGGDTTEYAVVSRIEEESETSEENDEQPDNNNPPGLPPRRTSRPRSPFHDVPMNNAPIMTHLQPASPTLDYTIDKILDDLEMESRRSDNKQQQQQQQISAEELSVRALIEKFNQTAVIVNDGESTTAAATNNQNVTSEDIADVSLRQKVADEQPNYAHIMNRHSDDLNKLLEELTKVTCAPLLTPGVTSSLVQMKSQPVTDEEWLAIAPIRRRRHSEPDYDVPRPHRSLQILPRSPDKEDTDADTVIPATRFFGPVLGTDKSYADHSMTWRSMTPDSLEPFQLMHSMVLKQQQQQQQRKPDTNFASDVEKDRSVGYANSSDFILTVGSPEELARTQDGDVREFACADVSGAAQQTSDLVDDLIARDWKTVDMFLDSLEPFSDSATTAAF